MPVFAILALAFTGGVGTAFAVLPSTSPGTNGSANGSANVSASLDAVDAGTSLAPSARPAKSSRSTWPWPSSSMPPPIPLTPTPLAASVPADPDALDAAGLNRADRNAGLLSVVVAPSASGELDVVPGAAAGPDAGSVRTIRVEVERGLPVDAALFAETVMSILNDPRGWGAGGAMTFARTDGDAELRVVLASPATIDAMCAPLRTNGEFSCGTNGRAAINLARWTLGTPEFGPDRTRYRHYVINHEVGHLLGHPHERCPGADQVAPVMQQQTVRAAPCVPNGWPHPSG